MNVLWLGFVWLGELSQEFLHSISLRARRSHSLQLFFSMSDVLTSLLCNGFKLFLSGSGSGCDLFLTVLLLFVGQFFLNHGQFLNVVLLLLLCTSVTGRRLASTLISHVKLHCIVTLNFCSVPFSESCYILFVMLYKLFLKLFLLLHSQLHSERCHLLFVMIFKLLLQLRHLLFGKFRRDNRRHFLEFLFSVTLDNGLNLLDIVKFLFRLIQPGRSCFTFLTIGLAQFGCLDH